MSRHILVSFLVLSLVGCGSRTEEPVFAVVDGEDIGESYVKNVVLIQAKMSELAGNLISADRFAEWANGVVQQLVPGLISAHLLDRELRRRNEEIAAEDRASVLSNYCSVVRVNATNETDLIRRFGELGPAFRDQFERSVRFAAFRRHHPATVTDADVATFLASQSNQLSRVAFIDGAAHKRAQAAWKRLKGGESWEAVASDVSEDRLVDENNAEFAQDWATVDLETFDNPEVAKSLLDMKVGDFSRPLEIDEGLVILRVVEIADKKWTLARILFRMAQPVENLSPDDVRARLLQERQNNIQLDLLNELRQKAAITYPLGTNFTYQIWKTEDDSKGKRKEGLRKIL